MVTTMMNFIRRLRPWRYAVPFVLCAASYAGHNTADAQTLDRAVGLPGQDSDLQRPLPVHPSHHYLVPSFARPEAVLPDPFGMTSWLRQRGIALTLDNTNEFSGAITPPTRGKAFVNYRQGASNAGQYSLGLHMDWEKLVGLKGFATHAIFTGRYGTTANRMFGDWLAHSSEIFGGGGNVVVHLVMAYGEETLAGGHLSLAAGRMTEMTDFAASPLYCNFMNNSLCGRPKALTDNQYAAAYPAGTWAFRVRGRPSRTTYVQTGVYFADAGIYLNNQHRTGFHFNGSNIKGQIVPMELGWEPTFGPKKKLAGHYKIGAQIINAPSADNYYSVADRSYALTRKTARQDQTAWTAWVLMDQKLMQFKHSGSDAGLTLLTGYIHNDPHVALRDWEVFGGLLARGFIRSRPYDTLGLAFTYVAIAPGVSASEAILLDERRSLPNHATGVQTYSPVVELNYAIHLMRGIVVQPDFEYYARPNAQGNLRPAAMLGVKTHIQLL